MSHHYGEHNQQSVRSRRDGGFVNFIEMKMIFITDFRLMVEQEGNVLFLIIFLMMLFILFIVFVISVYLYLNKNGRKESPEDLVVY